MNLRDKKIREYANDAMKLAECKIRDLYKSKEEHICNEFFKIKYSIGDVIYIYSIFVEKEFRNNGIAKRVINEIQCWYEKPIELECWETLIPYYTKIGFKHIGYTVDGYCIMYRDYNY